MSPETFSVSRRTTVDSEPFVSVIILNYDGLRFLETCLDSVFRSNYSNFEVVLVDNGSTDGSVDVIQKKFGNCPKLRIVQNEQNFGVAAGNNLGSYRAKGSLLVFLNNDTEVQPDWLTGLVKTATSEPSIGIVLCRVAWASSPKGLFVGNVDRYGNAMLVDSHAHFEVNQHQTISQGAPSNSTSAFETIAAGPVFLIKRDVWNKVGGFDKKYFMYAEDIDLAWRAKLLGYKTTLSYGSVVYHKIAGTTRKTGLARRRYMDHRNMLRTLAKNYSINTLLRIVPVFLMIRASESIALSLVARDPKVIVSLGKAIVWNIQNFSDTWVLHKGIQTFRVVSDREIQRVMGRFSIVSLFRKYPSR